MNKAQQLNQKILGCLKNYTLDKVDKYFKDLKDGDDRDQSYWREVYAIGNGYPCQMYSYLACAVKILKPKAVIEIGADRGVSALMMWSELPKDGILYSVDIRNGWEYIPSTIENIVKIQTDSTNPILSQIINLSEIKIWLIDGEHSNEKVKTEYDLYKSYWKKGTTVFFDDIDLYKDTWMAIKGNKYQSRDIHGQDFGVLVI